MDHSARRVAFFLPSLEGGGAERMMVNLLRGMAARQVPLDLVLGRATGPFLEQVPAEVRVIDLGAARMRFAIGPLAKYLRAERPHALLSRMNHANLAAIAARALSLTHVRTVVVEANNLTAQIAAGGIHPLVPPLVKRLYSRADAIVAVSHGVARDLIQRAPKVREKVQVIYNPVVDAELIRKSREAPDHPWLRNQSVPVFLAVGRLAPQKDFATLLHALAIVRRQRPVQLVILGDGPERATLQALRRSLNLEGDVAMPGFSKNPFAAMRCAQTFVMSSGFEGLPNSLIEAMACGCPVISTDCDSGPQEILDGGRYGRLVPVDDAPALARAMLDSLDSTVSPQILQRRANEFSLDEAVTQYLTVLGYEAHHARQRRAA